MALKLQYIVLFHSKYTYLHLIQQQFRHIPPSVMNLHKKRIHDILSVCVQDLLKIKNRPRCPTGVACRKNKPGAKKTFPAGKKISGGTFFRRLSHTVIRPHVSVRTSRRKNIGCLFPFPRVTQKTNRRPDCPNDKPERRLYADLYSSLIRTEKTKRVKPFRHKKSPCRCKGTKIGETVC